MFILFLFSLFCFFSFLFSLLMHTNSTAHRGRETMSCPRQLGYTILATVNREMMSESGNYIL